MIRRLPFLMLFFFFSTADAAFNQATCAITPAFDTRFTINIGATEYDLRPLTPIGNPDDFKFYNNNKNPNATTVLTNSNVVALKPLMGLFETEPGFDFLELVDNSGTFQYTGILNPSAAPELVAPRMWFPISSGGGAQSFTMRFFTDTSVAIKQPPRFTGVQASCKSKQSLTAANNRTLSLNTRYDGLLLKTGDTIYFQVVQPVNTPMILSMDGQTPGSDFDLYVSAAVLTPDASSFLYASTTSLPLEALRIPAAASVRTLYIGVTSASGGGHFRFNAMAQNPAVNRVVLNVCPISFTMTSSDVSAFSAFAREGAVDLLASSNGNLFIETYMILGSQPSCSVICDICLLNTVSGVGTGTPAAGHPCGVVTLGGAFWRGGAPLGPGLAHEFGHSCFGLPDEYSGAPMGSSSDTFCGHSNMNNSNTRMFCSNAHCSDGHHVQPFCNPSISNWASIASRIYYGVLYGVTSAAIPNNFSANDALKSLVWIL